MNEAVNVATQANTRLHHYTLSVYHGVVMALNIKNAEVERLAAEVARLTGESKTEAIRRALDERRRRLKGRPAERRRERVLQFLEKNGLADVARTASAAAG